MDTGWAKTTPEADIKAWKCLSAEGSKCHSYETSFKFKIEKTFIIGVAYGSQGELDAAGPNGLR